MKTLLDEVEKDLKTPQLSATTIYKLLDIWVSDLDIKRSVFLKMYLAYLLNARCSKSGVVNRTIEDTLEIKSRLNLILYNVNPTMKHSIKDIMKEFKSYTSLLVSVPKEAREIYTYNEWME
ncbi:hypothetical protein M1I53_000392 [Vibrio vulnificus]|nr:hypothetical protein [Vibrio vulnificus]